MADWQITACTWQEGTLVAAGLANRELMHAFRRLTETHRARQRLHYFLTPSQSGHSGRQIALLSCESGVGKPLLVVDGHSKGQVAHVHMVEQLRDVGGLVVDVRLHAQVTV